MRLLLSGYYGFGNFGDELLLEVIVDGVRRRLADVEIDVLSASPKDTARRFGVDATPRAQLRAVREAVARADIVLSGGGGLLQNATSVRSLLYYCGVIRMANRSRRTSMIFAQSIGPLDAFGSMIVRRFCKGTPRATVRDERSREMLASLLPETPVVRTADPAFLYRCAPTDLSGDGLGPNEYALACLRPSARLSSGMQTIVRAIDRLAAEHGLRTALLPLGGRADAEISTNVIRACKSAPLLLPETGPDKAAAIVANAAVVIGMRLHSLIVAAAHGVPFLAIPYDPKVSAVLEDLGYPLASLWEPTLGPNSPASSDALVDELVARRAELSAVLTSRMETIRVAAERNFDVLAELVA